MIKHTLKTMLLFEKESGKLFQLSSLNDIVDYMYLCYSTYTEDAKEKEEFIEDLTQEDIAEFCQQFETGKKKLMEENN